MKSPLPAADQRLVVISLDGHVCPRVAAFRPYCETQYLEQFEEFAAESDRHQMTLSASQGTDDVVSELRDRWLSHVAATYGSDELNVDPSLRLAEMDADGIAAEVVYHGGFNLHPIPFFNPDIHSTFNQDVPASAEAAELRAVGIRAYNRWLADWMAVAPERFIGVAHIPMWDVAASVEEVERASDDGLRGVNLPSPRRRLMGFNRPEWDPLWAVCQDRGLSLHTHGGGGDIFPIDGQGAWAIMASESRFLSRRGLSQLIFGGVFERFPRLSFFLTEQTERWVAETLTNYDSIYFSTMVERTVPFIRDVLPRRPSEYFRSNCYIGASFISRSEAQAAIDHDYWRNVMWGRDFPHPEGTWPFTRASMRTTFAGLPAEHVVAMLGENALRVLGFDARAMRAIADRIGPVLGEIDDPIDDVEIPDASRYSLAFRGMGSHA